VSSEKISLITEYYWNYHLFKALALMVVLLYSIREGNRGIVPPQVMGQRIFLQQSSALSVPKGAPNERIWRSVAIWCIVITIFSLPQNNSDCKALSVFSWSATCFAEFDKVRYKSPLRSRNQKTINDMKALVNCVSWIQGCKRK